MLVKIPRDWIDTNNLTSPDRLLFRTRNDTRPSGSNWARAWHRALDSVGQKPMRVYDCRHAAATSWLRAGMPLAETARRLGHSVETSSPLTSAPSTTKKKTRPTNASTDTSEQKTAITARRPIPSELHRDVRSIQSPFRARSPARRSHLILRRTICSLCRRAFCVLRQTLARGRSDRPIT